MKRMTLSRRVFFAKLVMASILLVSHVTAAAELLFIESFETGDLSRHNNHFRWGSGGSQSPGVGSGRIVEVVGPLGRPVNALRFRYIGFEDGGSGDAAHWSEQRFTLTRSSNEARSSNGHSSVIYPEVWISVWMHVPSNYFHMMRGGRPSGDNQKGWIYLWKDAYERWTSQWSDDDVTPTALNVSWWPLSDDPEHVNFGASRMNIMATRHRTNWGARNTPTFIRQAERIVGSTNLPYAFLKSEHGTWVHYTFGARVASSPANADGFFRMYKNGELAVAWEGLDNGSDVPTKNGFDRGYIMGYHNTGYAKTTEYLITDFRFGTSKQGVLTADANNKSPGSPVLMLAH
jgi:hypothetical protein